MIFDDAPMLCGTQDLQPKVMPHPFRTGVIVEDSYGEAVAY
jgi:hypothetical protein